jgi:hypothetical protein
VAVSHICRWLGCAALALALSGGVAFLAGFASPDSAQRGGPAGPRVRALLISAGAFHDYAHQSQVFVRAIGKQVEKVWPGARPLATAVDYRDKKEYPVAWAHDYRGVRVFGTTLGHGTATWDDPDYQALLVRGFLWAAGREQ